MTKKRTKRIIAVFGGHKVGDCVLNFADDLGRAVAARQQILLTGGSGPGAKDPKTVKNRAIGGAIPESWVGVERMERPEPSIPTPPRGLSITLPELDNRRNYVEALMCDGAIAVEGGPGTISEIISSLSLGRPVALAGDYWKPTWEALQSDRSSTLDDLCGRASAHMLGKTEGGPFSEQVSRDALGAGLSEHEPLAIQWFPGNIPAIQVVDWITQKVPVDAGLRDDFPVGGEIDAAVEACFRNWLAGQLTAEEAIAVYDEVIERFADTTEPAVQEQVARALYNKGVRLAELGRSEEAIAVYDEVIARFADTTGPALQEQVAKARSARAQR